MNQNQYTMLFKEDNTSLRTLLSPINLQAFYEWYKQGDFVSIKKRFSYDPVHSPITDFEVEGIYNYLEHLVKHLIDFGPGAESDDDYIHYTSYGTLWAQTMQKVRLYITEVVEKTMPTRFWASYNDVNKMTCEMYIKDIALNATNAATFCTKFAFTVQNLENISTLVMASQGNATAQDEIMNGFWDATSKKGFNVT